MRYYSLSVSLTFLTLPCADDHRSVSLWIHGSYLDKRRGGRKLFFETYQGIKEVQVDEVRGCLCLLIESHCSFFSFICPCLATHLGALVTCYPAGINMSMWEVGERSVECFAGLMAVVDWICMLESLVLHNNETQAAVFFSRIWFFLMGGNSYFI